MVEVGYFGAGQFIPCDELSAGHGWLYDSQHQKCEGYPGGRYDHRRETIPAHEPLPGYKKVNPMVYCGMYPADGAKYPDLRDALGKTAAKRCFPSV